MLRHADVRLVQLRLASRRQDQRRVQARRLVRVTDQFPPNLLDERRSPPSRPRPLGDGGGADPLLHLLGGVQNQPDRSARPFQNLHARLRDADLFLLCVGLDVAEAAAQVGVVAHPQDFQQHSAAEFGHRLAAPVLAHLLQVAVAVVGGVDEFVHQVERFLTATSMRFPLR